MIPAEEYKEFEKYKDIISKIPEDALSCFNRYCESLEEIIEYKHQIREVLSSIDYQYNAGFDLSDSLRDLSDAVDGLCNCIDFIEDEDSIWKDKEDGFADIDYLAKQEDLFSLENDHINSHYEDEDYYNYYYGTSVYAIPYYSEVELCDISKNQCPCNFMPDVENAVL